MMRIIRAAGFAADVLLLAGAGVAQARVERPATVDCSVDGRTLTCDRADFLRRFAEARTLALESQPKDRIADGQLASFANRSEKTLCRCRRRT